MAESHITRIVNQMEIIVLFYFVLVYFVCLIKHVFLFLIKYKETVAKSLDIVMKIDTFLRKDRVQNQIYDYE